MNELDEKLPIGAEEIAEATQILQRYKAGKAALDKRLIDNELWFRMGHWKNYQNPMMEGKPQPSSGWLFNSIANKHADAMDNYPAPNVLPRAADDEATAQTLSSVLPVVLEQADYEQVYSDSWWRKLKQGTGVKGVFWDPEQRGGVGEIAIRPMNLLMLYWEPGVDDIQASPHFLAESGRHETIGSSLAPAGGTQRQRAGRAPVSPRRRAGREQQERGGGLVLQKAGPGRPNAAALLQVLQRSRPLRQRE